jgi:hypothetical protein
VIDSLSDIFHEIVVENGDFDVYEEYGWNRETSKDVLDAEVRRNPKLRSYFQVSLHLFLSQLILKIY